MRLLNRRPSEMPTKPIDPTVRFERYFIPEPNSGCWLWTGALSSNGYGSFYNGERMVSAHSFAFKCHVGPVPDGLELDHLCRTRCCVNPAHLEPVTRRENTKRGTAGHHMRGKTHCSKGHPLDEVNTYWRSNGNRSCRICERLKRRRHRRARRAHEPIAA